MAATTQNEELIMEFALHAFNLDTGHCVKEALEKLEQMEVPVEQYHVYNIASLARRFLITDGVKDQARKLLAKVRRAEGSSKGLRRSGSSSDEGSSKRKRSTTPEEEMLSSKKTAPVIFAGKKRKADEVASSSPTTSQKETKTDKKGELEMEKKKKMEQEDKLRKFLERRKTSVAVKKAVKPMTMSSEALSVVGEYRQRRIEEAKLARETGQWPVVREAAAAGRRRRF